MMIIIRGNSFDPWFNLASEEYLLKNTEDDVFMLWRNGRSVIIGKNQNAYAEVDRAFIRENGIKVARRITGGGAVFHDEGNVNFTFITDATDENKLNFVIFLSPIVTALSKLGIEATIDGRNDLTADGFKISGNAECVEKSNSGKDRVLHHGTLLFNADMSSLAGALNPSRKKLEAKGIKSVRSRVCNISSLESYNGPSDTEEFMEALLSAIADGKARALTEEECAAIEKLSKEKFSTDEWIWGKSPEFDIKNEKRFPFGTVCAETKCDKGKIKSIRLTGDYFGTEDISEIENALVGVAFDEKEISLKLSSLSDILGKCISGSAPSELAALIAAEQ